MLFLDKSCFHAQFAGGCRVVFARAPTSTLHRRDLIMFLLLLLLLLARRLGVLSYYWGI